VDEFPCVDEVVYGDEVKSLPEFFKKEIFCNTIKKEPIDCCKEENINKGFMKSAPKNLIWNEDEIKDKGNRKIDCSDQIIEKTDPVDFH
jgi:hypothetical protein